MTPIHDPPPVDRPPPGEHLDKTSFTQEVLVPDHPPRKASAEFERNRVVLLVKKGVGCWICGSTGTKAAPLEVHHLHEWSLWGALDPDKVLQTLHCFDPYGFTEQAGEKPIESPDDIRNLLVLCSSCDLEGRPVAGGHHRGLDCGVHALTWPVWLPQRAVKAGVSLTEALGAAKAADPALAGPGKPE